MTTALVSKIPASPPGTLYVYRATIERLIDGDTVCARVDLGFSTWRTEKFRLAHINTPEMNTLGGHISKEFVTTWTAKQKTFTFYSKGQDKYGRWVAVIWGDDLTISLNQLLLDADLAIAYL